MLLKLSYIWRWVTVRFKNYQFFPKLVSHLTYPTKYYKILSIIIFTISLIIITNSHHYIIAQTANQQLPPLQIHPLPQKLEQWQTNNSNDDYFNEIKQTSVGYLILSQFPVKIYIEQPLTPDDGSANWRNFQQWVAFMRQAVEEWNIYLPLLEVSNREDADIIIMRSQPDNFNQKNENLDNNRARTAQTSYQFYLSSDNPPLLLHRMTIIIKPGQSNPVLISAIRHELGHALGIWGHSPLESDIMYFSQVRQPTTISPRDINTLKKIYQQPTRLGFSIQQH